jgi:4-diphosphocytidyl-2-C-methyl-D-erythritol kinase
VLLLRAPAKINLTLEVLGRRDDGYHRLRSAIVPISLHDQITIEEGGRGLQFTSDCAEIDVEDNLVVNAIRALALPRNDFKISLKKEIPIGAGLGGGSSDAAAILQAAMNGAFGNVAAKDHLAIARRLGSDVPFFLAQTAAVVEGTGERVTPLGTVPEWSCTVVCPPIAISTADAYAQLELVERSRARGSSATIELGEALQRGDLERVKTLAQNDFEKWAAASYPEVGIALKILAEWNAGFAHLTGSGAAVYTIYERAPAAPLALPAGFQRFDATFVRTPVWRTESA